MGFEIEIKAAVDNSELLQSKIAELGAQFIREYHKRDEYYRLSYNPGVSIRLRIDGESAVVTHKEKVIEKGIERNREREFTVDSAEDFRHFLDVSGYSESIRKIKTGSAWMLKSCLVEVSLITDLGWYVEVEKILPDDASSSEVESAASEVLSLLVELGIAEDSIETRTYTSMLEQARNQT